MKKVFRKDNFGRDNDDRGSREMHEAVCSECGKKCQIPFKPSDDRPVYCDDCFRNKQKSNSRGSDRGRFDRPSFGRPSFRGGDRQMFQAVCANCGTRCEVPFEPRGGKPVYCNNCFGKNERGGGGGGGRQGGGQQFDEQFRTLNAKLDRILGILAPSHIAPVISEKKPAPEIKTPDVKKAIKAAMGKKDKAVKPVAVKKIVEKKTALKPKKSAKKGKTKK